VENGGGVEGLFCYEAVPDSGEEFVCWRSALSSIVCSVPRLLLSSYTAALRIAGVDVWELESELSPLGVDALQWLHLLQQRLHGLHELPHLH
jgi:hypothetical protein